MTECPQCGHEFRVPRPGAKGMKRNTKGSCGALKLRACPECKAAGEMLLLGTVAMRAHKRTFHPKKGAAHANQAE